MKPVGEWLPLAWNWLYLKVRRVWHDRDIRGGLIWWAGLSLFVCLISVMVIVTNGNSSSIISIDSNAVSTSPKADNNASNNHQITISNIHTKEFTFGYIVFAFSAGIVLGVLIWSLYKYKWPQKHIGDGKFDVITSGQTRKDIISGTVITLFALVITLTITILFLDYPVNFAKLWNKFLDNPGGLFAFVTGGGTLIGTYIAIKSILEMRHTITSYPQLLDRVTNLIKSAPDTEGGIRILSYFVLPGSWQVRSKTIKKSFKEALKNEKRLIRMVCLDPADLLNIVTAIAKKGTNLYRDIKPEDVLKYQIECEHLIMSFGWDNRDKQYRFKPIRLKWDQMPGFYFFVSDERAIVVTPVGLPQINKEINTTKINRMITVMHRTNYNLTEAIEKELSKLIKKEMDNVNGGKNVHDTAEVETLGFETTDRHIIEKLQGLFDMIVLKNR